MKLRRLVLEKIGPFDEAELDFTRDGEVVPVTIITGENGTGKTLLLDVVRTMFGPQFSGEVRSVVRPGELGAVEIELDGLAHGHVARAQPKLREHPELALLPASVQNGRLAPVPWVVDYWTSQSTAGDFKVDALQPVPVAAYLTRALDGAIRNADTTQFICQADYLRDSRDPLEQADGEALWSAIADLARSALINGTLDRVMRATLTPVFIQHGRELELRHLNAGSLYILQHTLRLLARMYCCYVLNGRTGAIRDIPGLLLIDEAENHLHPKWQKRFLSIVRTSFPNLQIVATTHSPFIVASAPADAKVFVCEERGSRGCAVRDVSQEYGNLPIDEVLTMPVFSETLPFSETLTELVKERRATIERGDEARRAEIEAELKRLNPEEFGYLDLPEDLQQLLRPTGS